MASLVLNIVALLVLVYALYHIIAAEKHRTAECPPWGSFKRLFTVWTWKAGKAWFTPEGQRHHRIGAISAVVGVAFFFTARFLE